MYKESLSYCEAVRRFDIRDHSSVESWERIYLKEGADGFRIKQWGCKLTGRPKKEAEEDLIAEV